MGLTTWMKKCVVFVQIWIKHAGMKGNVVGFFGGKECVDAPQRLLGFATMLNMWDLVGSLEPDNHFLRLVWFYHNLRPRSSSSYIFSAFSKVSFM